MLKIAIIAFLGVITAAVMVAGSNSVSAQTSAGNPQFKEAELLAWIKESADDRNHRFDESKLVGYAAGFTFVINGSCKFLPSEVARIVKIAYDRVRRGELANLSHRITVEGALAGIEDAKLFVVQNGCDAPDSKRAQQNLLKTWERTTAQFYARNLPHEPKV